MKELHSIRNRSTNKLLTLTNVGSRKRRKVITRLRSKAPAAASPEIPILCVLSRAPNTGVSTGQVLQELQSAKWFGELDEDDRQARYETSKRKIVSTVIKYAKKTLAMKGEVFQVGEAGPLGVWKITAKGLERATMLQAGWKPRYSFHNAIKIEEEKK